jgi:uncharacterized coiled-coil DUF342 family protein
MEDFLLLRKLDAYKEEINVMRFKVNELNGRIEMLTQRLDKLYSKVDKADQFLEQSRITDAKLDRLLAVFVQRQQH